jgi:hypothetical protein
MAKMAIFLKKNDEFTIATIGRDEYFIDEVGIDNKFIDNTGTSVVADLAEYVQEDSETIDADYDDTITDSNGNVGNRIIGGRPKKCRRK